MSTAVTSATATDTRRPPALFADRVRNAALTDVRRAPAASRGLLSADRLPNGDPSHLTLWGFEDPSARSGARRA